MSFATGDDPRTTAEWGAAAADRSDDVVKSYVHESATDVVADPINALVQQLKTPDNDDTFIRQLYMLPSAGIDTTHGHLEGIAVTLAADAPAAPFTDTHLLGTGVTWFRVKSTAGAAIDDAAIVAAHSAICAEHPGMRVSLVSGIDYPNKAHYVVVEGNDRDAARELATRASQSTVEELVQGSLASDYQALMTSSYDRRLEAAGAFIDKHELAVDSTLPTGNHPTYFIDHVRSLSRRAESSRQRAVNTFVAMLGASDPSSSHSGVMMYRGPIAGYALARAREASSVKGADSWAFNNMPKDGKGRAFSVMPATTGVYIANSARAADRHKFTNASVNAAHAERVCWAGPLRSYNPRADVAYHSTNDAHWIAMMSNFGMTPGGAVETIALDTVVSEVEAIDTTHMSLDALVDVLRSSNEVEVRASTASALAWLAATPNDAAKMRLADVFSRQDGDVTVLQRDVVERLHAATK